MKCLGRCTGGSFLNGIAASFLVSSDGAGGLLSKRENNLRKNSLHHFPEPPVDPDQDEET